MRKFCIGCSTEFEPRNKRMIYCSMRCRKRVNERQKREEVKESVANARASRYPRIARKKNKKGEFVSESTKSCWDYFQG